MFNATTASLAQLRAFAADNDIYIDGDKRRKQSYIDSIQAWQAECGQFEPVEDGDISLEELESDELPWEETAEQTEVTACSGFAPILLLLCHFVLFLVALPILLTGGLLRALAFGFDKFFDWLASPQPVRWGGIQSLLLAIP